MRSAQRRFVRATGITYAAYRTIERARYATNLLREGVPIIDVVHRAGYYDQPHLTRSFDYLIGQTPSEVARATRQLSFLYKTTSGGTFYGEWKEADSMRFMTLIKSAEDTNLGPPPAVLFQAIARLGDEAKQAGVLVETAGLMPTAAGALVRLNGGQISTSEGPFGLGREIVGGYAIFNVGSKQEAIDWAKRFMELHRDHWSGWHGETEVRRMIEPQPGAGAPRG